MNRITVKKRCLRKVVLYKWGGDEIDFESFAYSGLGLVLFGLLMGGALAMVQSFILMLFEVGELGVANILVGVNVCVGGFIPILWLVSQVTREVYWVEVKYLAKEEL